VTVNVAVIKPMLLVALIVYMPGGTCGTVINRLALLVPGHVVAFPTLIVPKAMSNVGPGNPRVWTINVLPAGP